MGTATTARRLATLVVAGCLVAPVARAQSAEEIAEARVLFNEALSQETAGDWAGALEKMQKVSLVKLTPQVRYHLGRCKEHLGRHTEALGDYRLAEIEAQKSGAPELEEITRARADLEERVPKLRVRLPASAAGARVTLDGVELGPSQLGQEIPVNPGRHRLVAKLGDREWHKRFKAREGRSSKIDLSPPDEAGGGGATEDPGAERPKPDSGEGDSTLPWVAAGVGALGFIGAGVFYGLHIGAENELETRCRGPVCPESVRDEQDKSDRYRVLSGVSLAVGVAGAGTAAVLWLTQGSSDQEKTTARVGIGAQPNGIRLHGRF